MAWKTKRTGDTSLSSAHKVLLYASHGFGKTYQARHMRERYGNGLIISGEGGLRTIGDIEIDYLPFTSWDGEHDHSAEVYSFMGIVRDLSSPEFWEQDYKWIMVDSLTEMSDMLHKEVEQKHDAKGGKRNGFEIWGEYSSSMIGALKIIRDMPLHVVVTCLAKDEEDENGRTHYWPHIKGNAVGKQLCGIFDHVFAGVRHSVETTDADTGATKTVVERYIVTDELKGYHGKCRDPFMRLPPVAKCSNITELLDEISRKPSEEAKTAATPADVDTSS